VRDPWRVNGAGTRQTDLLMGREALFRAAYLEVRPENPLPAKMSGTIKMLFPWSRAAEQHHDISR